MIDDQYLTSMAAIDINIISVRGVLLALYLIYKITKHCTILVGSDRDLSEEAWCRIESLYHQSKPDHDLAQSTIIIKKNCSCY